mmetsp:Transcript_104729/g.208080  ORF Transcript_104729/g.208080 Transcript_104729/m.208080 type:complete len:188 (+) Transcript_104729:55-618(+)
MLLPCCSTLAVFLLPMGMAAMPALREHHSTLPDAALDATVMNSSHDSKFEEHANITYTATATNDRDQQADYTILESIPVAMGMAAPAVAMAVWESTFSLSSMSPQAHLRHVREADRGHTANTLAQARMKRALGFLNQTRPQAEGKRLAINGGLRGSANMVMETTSKNYQAPAAFTPSLHRGQAEQET